MANLSEELTWAAVINIQSEQIEQLQKKLFKDLRATKPPQP